MYIGEFASLCSKELHIDPFTARAVRIQAIREEDFAECRAEGFRRDGEYAVFLSDGAIGVARAAAEEMELSLEELQELPPDTPLPARASTIAERLAELVMSRPPLA